MVSAGPPRGPSVLGRRSANMQVVRGLQNASATRLSSCRLFFFFVVGFFCFSWIVTTVQADCWYNNDRHEEGTEVSTAEPCLNCTCSRGVLLCYLRVCPKLPDPPPLGCILVHRYRKCCPELICTDFPGGGNGLEARSEPENELDFPFDPTILRNACISNGSIYGPGSAMDSSSLCEYCYCLGGKQTCVKPKCLLPIDDCVPTYDPTHCCPIRYNCSYTTTISTTASTTTTTKIPQRLKDQGGCLVDGIFHHEGGKVLGMGHSICDNCYCLKGVLRCEPLSCAPPLLGCSPIIKPGECCAASYNCSGTIEIQPEPNYGHFPIVSKEYAKLRKEVQRQPPNTKGFVTVAPSYIFPDTSQASTTKQRSTGTFGTTRHFAGISFFPSTAQPNNHDMSSRESHKQSTRSYPESKVSFPGHYYATTNYEFQNRNYKRVLSTTNRPKPTQMTTMKTVNLITSTPTMETHNKSPDYLDSIEQNIFSLFESFLSDPSEETTDSTTTTTDIVKKDLTGVTNNMSETTTILITTTEMASETNAIETDQTNIDKQITTETDKLTTTEAVSTTLSSLNNSYPLTVKSVVTSTDCVNGTDATLELPESNEIESTTLIRDINNLVEARRPEENSFTTTDRNDLVQTEQTTWKLLKTATLRNIPDIEAILNISKHKDEDYEYDYNEPSLPPSLPNLKIIPFVAADAVDSKKEPTSSEVVVYLEEKLPISDYGYTNLFSPPTETEGGFVPKNPSVLDDNYYENVVTPPSLASESKPNANCINHDGTEIMHGQSVGSSSPCVTCTCFYGNIVCQKPTCPIPKPGCRKSVVQDVTLCCPLYVCDDIEAPTVVLDRIDGNLNNEAVTIAEKLLTPDPFKDVIRTEPAPNLQSLMSDMMPFLARKTTPLSQGTEKRQLTTSSPASTSSTTTKKPEKQSEDDGFSLDKVFQLFFTNEQEDNQDDITINKDKIQNNLPANQTIERNSTEMNLVSPSTTQKPNLPPSTSTPTSTTTEDRIADEQSPSSTAPSTGMALLINLAGCNIYGRMYRVGRIISELSGPCLECKCTEIGVQCQPLKC